MTLAAVQLLLSGLTLEQIPASAALRAALRAADLPIADLADRGRVWFVARQDGRIVGHCGLEPYGAVALLRSVVVGERGRGTGTALVQAICAEAARRGIRSLYLLTTSAEPFFARLGFVRSERAAVPPEIAASREFASLCPSTAVVMRKPLDS